MAKEVITLDVQPTTIIVTDGAMEKARLTYQADGLDIYVNGQVRASRWHAVHYQACLECAARHIPVISLRDVGRRAPAIKPISPDQKRMF